MKTNSLITKQELLTILESARLAPSVHNTQPWLVASQGNHVTVTLNKHHVLTDGDPTGRQTVISIGIFCETIRFVALEYGIEATKIHYEHQVAHLEFKRLSKSVTHTSTLSLLSKRATDRSIYKPVDVSKRDIKVLQGGTKGLKARVHVVVDDSVIQAVAELTSHGIDLALSTPGFRKELSQYLLLPSSKKKRGISVKSLYLPRLVAVLQPSLMKRGLGLNKEAQLERKRWESASAIVVITADGDLSKYWFDVGRAYLRVSLAIESLGLSQATSAAIVEASNYHEDVETMIGTNQRVLSLIRVGKGNSVRHYSPRVSAAEILT